MKLIVLHESSTPTRGVVSTYGVANSLAFNLLEENHVEADVREELQREIQEIFEGKRSGVPGEKVAVRAVERIQPMISFGGLIVGAN